MKITLLENFRAIFYIPFYAPIALGAYENEGMEVVIHASTEAAKTISSLVAGDAEISWGGLSRLMQGLDGVGQRQPVAFCEVIARDPFFLIGREANPHFRLDDLTQCRVGIVSEVPAPWMCLQYDLQLAGIDPARVQCVTGRTMAENVMALRAREVDVIQVFHPFAHELAVSDGHIWYSAAKRGPATYTTLNTTREFAKRSPDVLMRICRATYRTQRWIASHRAQDLARAVAAFFPEVPIDVLSACIQHYKDLEIWSVSPIVSRAGFDWIRDAGLACGRVPRRYIYDECVDSHFAQQAIAAVSESQ